MDDQIAAIRLLSLFLASNEAFAVAVIDRTATGMILATKRNLLELA